jgi:6-phosphofructokinase 1
MKSPKKVAILTSGGDAPGMNAAIRGTVRAALNKGWEVYGIRDGYRGLLEGGDMIFPLDWVDVSWNFREGGTFLGSARCPELKENTPQAKKLKEKALMNLYRHNIADLVIVGGDGSLTGGYALFSLLQKREYRNPALKRMKLSIVGIPGSIDNDIAYTDMSIGVDTTLNTIVECIDRLRDTATSHRRVIIVEVMGRRRGYLAVMSGLATGADRIFIREERVSHSELDTTLLVLQKSFEQGQKAGIIVRAEGAPVSTTFLKETIAVLLDPKREVRETILGHLQRGGNPTVFERTLATRMGVRAIQLLDTISQEPQLVKLNAKKIGSTPLIKSLTKIKTPAFQEGLSSNTKTALFLSRKLEMSPEEKSRGMCIGLLTDGTNVSGMNMAIRAVARLALNRGIAIKGIKGGFSGLSKGPESTVNLQWSMLEMKSILRRAGTLLGVSSSGFPLDEKGYGTIKKQVKQLKIDGLIVIGNTTTYRAAHRLSALINIPVVGIPAASHCNLPETDWVIGMDSTLNDLLQGIDRAADAAHVTRKIFIVHLKGAFCNCLVKLVALAGGAEQVLIYEHAADPTAQDTFQETVRDSMNELKKMIALGKTFGTFVFYSHHPATADQTVESIKQSLHRAGIPLETTIIPLETSLGGITPTAFDRILAKRLGEKALETVLTKIADRDHSFHIVGIKGKEIVVPPYKDSFDKDTASCSSNLETELERCFDLMAQPSGLCIGMGGKVQGAMDSHE